MGLCQALWHRFQASTKKKAVPTTNVAAAQQMRKIF